MLAMSQEWERQKEYRCAHIDLEPLDLSLDLISKPTKTDYQLFAQ